MLSSRRSFERASSDDPLAVDVERAALELAVAGVVQLGDDDERDVAPGERQLSGFANPLELGDRTEVDLLLREDPAESASLSAAGLGQRARDAGVTVDELLRAVLRLPVAREQAAASQEDAAVVQHVLHPDLLVETDRRLVLGADEEADARHALEQQPDEIAKPALPVAGAARDRGRSRPAAAVRPPASRPRPPP